MATRRLACASVLALAVVATPALGASQTTERVTIVDRDGDNRLEPWIGDDHLLRQDLGTKTPAADPLSLKFFAQLTDTHVVDEESPLRVEFTDRYGRPFFTSAYRPQEGLSAQVMDEMVRQVRNTVSPVDSRRLDLVMTTGDNTDNTQCNETRWMIDLMDGTDDVPGAEVDPDSGIERASDLSARELCREQEAPPEHYVPGCNPENGSIYDGVRGSGEYYEPDTSAGQDDDEKGADEAGEDPIDGPGYSPDRTENQREARRDSNVRDRPGLFEEMNQPFEAKGFDDLEWYGIFGNHDGLIQGNQPRNPVFEALAVGCAKVTGLSPAAEVAARLAGDQAGAFAQILAGMQRSAQEGDDSLVEIVPPDPRRRPLKKSEYIAEHFKTTGVPVGHGFTEANVATGMGNYSFNPDGDPGLRFVVLDSISEHGLEAGNIDHEQFEWLHDELTAADKSGQLAVVFAHHSLRTMGQPPISPFPPGDAGGNLSPAVHYGEGPRETGQPLPCTERRPDAKPEPTETLRCLFLRHPSVIAFVNGHEHANRVTPYPRNEGDGPAEGGFWEINTASHIDWPQQSRTIDIVDNRDGSLSIWATLIDHGGSANPGVLSARGATVQRLASISRELSFNDPHASSGEEDWGDARGGEEDRNVELVVRDPRG